MSFFEDVPPAEPPPNLRQPEWMGPPENVLGTPLPLSLVLARTDDAVVAVPRASAFPTGALLDVAVRLRSPSLELRRALVHGGPFHRAWPSDESGGAPPELLRLGVQFSDGRKATTLGWPGWGEDPPAGPVLVPRGGSGGESAWDMGLWLWPLPPVGPLVLACEWPLLGMPLTTVQVDAALLHEAAARAETLWPGGGGAAGGGWLSSQVLLAARDDEPPPTT